MLNYNTPEPLYFSGLNYKEAEKYIGSKVDASINGQEWVPGVTLTGLNTDPNIPQKFQCKNYNYNYICVNPDVRCLVDRITLTIADKDYHLPLPETEPLEEGTMYWVYDPVMDTTFRRLWLEDLLTRTRLYNGFVHLTKDRVDARARCGQALKAHLRRKNQ